jgi:hypothetical protein
MQFLAPELIQKIGDIRNSKLQGSEDAVSGDLEILRKGMESILLTRPFPLTESISQGGFTDAVADSALSWLEDYRERLARSREKLAREKDAIAKSVMEASGGTPGMIALKRRYHNEKVAEIVLNRLDLRKIVETEGRFIRKMEPVYQYPAMKNGRAQFYASLKNIGEWYIPTLAFNTAAIWFMSLLLYLALQYSLLRKGMEYFLYLFKHRYH